MSHKQAEQEQEQIGSDKGSVEQVEQKDGENPAKTLDKTLALLQAPDDTSHFVGLALLKSILDNHQSLREDGAIVTRCWTAIPVKFLDRLLKARPNEKKSKEETQSMVALAVAIVHAFVTLLPSQMLKDANLMGRIDGLVAAVPFSTPETVVQISQILMALNFPSLLFSTLARTGQYSQNRDSPYFFIKLLLVDIRATLPSLQEQHKSDEYPAISSRIAESYDVLSNFIGYLVQSLDEDESQSDSRPFSLDPSQLLQLRADISETMSLTIEHLRECYDASIAGAGVIVPSAQIDNDSMSSASRFNTLGSSSKSMTEDPVTLAELRTLALWLREDDNDALRKEAAGITDILLALYAAEDIGSDIRSPILIALEGILAVSTGIEAFMSEDGWRPLTTDLKAVLASSSTGSVNRGIEIVRVLMTIVESDIVGPAKEEWMEMVHLSVQALQ
ncbi:MAG: hypothetical protein Q9191_000842, partial [Dirinaria sp. TL-2023a]